MMSETVLLGGVSPETNTFAPTKTRREDFQEHREYVGEEIVERMRGTNTSVGGAIDTAYAESVELVPTIEASATPGGTVSREGRVKLSRNRYTAAGLTGIGGHAFLPANLSLSRDVRRIQRKWTFQWTGC